MNDFSERLMWLYHNSDYKSVREVAQICDVSPDSMSKYMDGQTRPTYKVLVRLRQAYEGLDYNWLLFGENKSFS